MSSNAKKKVPEKNGTSAMKTTVDNKHLSVWTRAFTCNSEWADKEEFLDVIYWIRQVLGLLLGVFWGILPLKGVIGLALFILVNVGIVYFYFSSFQCVDEEDYGGAWELVKEGFMTSFAGFLMMWIIFYTGLHFP